MGKVETRPGVELEERNLKQWLSRALSMNLEEKGDGAVAGEAGEVKKGALLMGLIGARLDFEGSKLIKKTANGRESSSQVGIVLR